MGRNKGWVREKDKELAEKVVKKGKDSLKSGFLGAYSCSLLLLLGFSFWPLWLVAVAWMIMIFLNGRMGEVSEKHEEENEVPADQQGEVYEAVWGGRIKTFAYILLLIALLGLAGMCSVPMEG